MMGGGVQVFVRDGRLMLGALTLAPDLWRGHLLHPDSETDPYVFRLDLSELAMPPVRLVFDRDPDRRRNHRPRRATDLARDPRESGRAWTGGALGAARCWRWLALRRARSRRKVPR